MASVIYTGPLNPVIYARAKKEAEKAERIKGYKPRIIKTAAYMVIYNKVGDKWKAIVSDDLAPITFSIPGSAIPVAPNFLHLHPDLPEKVYGIENHSSASGVVKNWGIASDYIGDNYAGFLFPENESSSFINNSVALATWNDTQYLALKNFWDYSNGFPPSGSVVSASESNAQVENFGKISTYATLNHTISQTDFNGYFSDKIDIGTGQYKDQTKNGATTYTSFASFVNINADIRDFTKEIIGNYSTENIKTSDIAVNFSFEYKNGAEYHSTRQSSVGLLNIDDKKSIILCSGRVGFSFVEIHNDNKIDYSLTGGESYFSSSIVSKTRIEHGVRDFSFEPDSLSRLIVDSDKVYYDDSISDQGQYENFFKKSISESGTEFDKHVFVSGSIRDDGFFGVLVWAKIYTAYPDIQKAQYQSDSVFSKSHLAYYFDIFKGQYKESGSPFWEPPDTTSDGICLPHAWWFCRGNETRETHFYANNHNRLTVVIYPQGRHEFSVDEAEIVSVELDHTPQFVIKPGGQFAFGLTSFTTKAGPFPYVIEGLVEELDEYGEKTGFYLAQDGVVSGEFSATHTNVEFTLSPRQPTEASRLVVMAVTTERATPVVSHVEVLGKGPRVSLPMSVGIECLTAEILAGQAASFYVTCTSVANDSQLPYTIKRGGGVVRTGFFNVNNGASWDTYGPPATSRPVEAGSTTQYVVCDASTTGTSQQSTTYEITVGPDGNQATASFVVVSASERYANSSDRPPAIDLSDLPPMFFLQSFYKRDFGDGIIQYAAANVQHTLINRIYYSIKKKRVYVLFWDGQSCDVTDLIRLNNDTGAYEPNPDWVESSFDYPPVTDPYNIKGTLEPYVYAYLEYENNRTGS
jgi:hypothetical protein